MNLIFWQGRSHLVSPPNISSLFNAILFSFYLFSTPQIRHYTFVEYKLIIITVL
jgi:hypothetical protein